MNMKRFTLCTIIGFAFVFAFDFIVHGILLVPTYNLTPELWRPMEDYKAYMPFATAMQVITTAILCYIYTLGHEGKGLKEGLRFGIIFGLLLGFMACSSYAWMPISIALATSWFATTFVKTIGLGIIFAFIYKKQ